MEDYKKKSVVDGDKEIVFSKAIKAGKRIYGDRWMVSGDGQKR